MESPFTEMREIDLKGKIRCQSVHVNFKVPLTYLSGVKE